MFHTLILASIIKIFNNRVKVIFTAHNSFHAMKIRRIVLWLLKPFRNFDTVFSTKAINFFHKKSSVVIPNGVDVDAYITNSNKRLNKPFSFIVIGRLEQMKNHSFLIDEISKLSNYDFRVLIVGSGILETELKEKVSNLRLEDKIKFLGARDDVPELLSKSDCLLLPSLWEAFPLVLFPGMEVKSSFFDGVVRGYTPSFPEIVLGIGGIAVAAVIIMIGLKALRFLPTTLEDGAVDPNFKSAI